MNNLLFAFNTVFPLCMMLLLGYMARRLHWLKAETIRQMNQVCFYLFLPASLFSSVYHSTWQHISWQLILFAIIVVLFSFLIVLWVVQHTTMENKRKGVVVQGIFRSNFILFGLPLTISFFGEEQSGTTAVLIAFIIPLYNILSILVLQGYGEAKMTVHSLLKKTLANPLIIGAILAFICTIWNLKLMPSIEVSIKMLANSATPLALFLLGASFVFSKLYHNLRILILSTIVKLVVIPACVVGIALLCGFQQEALIALLAMSASPTAVSSFTMAQSMHMDYEIAGQMVVVTTICSIITLFLWITIAKQILI